ncbi:MAG: hypothetical protein J6X18_09040 [Bacteroidales bacterium]|nr:hypothetical protein [Bacteroidales bacterium]
MGQFIDRLHRKARNFMIALSFALKRTEEHTLRQNGDDIDAGIGAEQQINENRVSKALLKGEVTQEVKQLRYRTYKVDEEAKEQEYYSPLKAIKREKQDNRHIKYKKPEGCTLILIQPNKPEAESVYESINKFENKDREPQQYTIRIKRRFVPRFRLEEYTRRLALFSREDGSTVADFYVSKYPDPSEFKAKAFIREVKTVMESGRKSDLTDFSSFTFETYKCYNSEDYQEYTLKKCSLECFDEYDGNYIFRYVTKETPEVVNNRLSDKFYDAEMEKRYRNKEKKIATFDLNPYSDINKVEYVCSKCGKKFYYDLNEIDAVEPHEARMVDEESTDDSETTTYLDMQMTEQATGMRLCKDCLEKEYEKLVSQMAKEQ